MIDPASWRLWFVVVLMGACRVSSDQPPFQNNTDADQVKREVESAVWAFHAADTAMDAEAVIDLLWPEYTMLVDGEWVEYGNVVEGSRAFMESLSLFHTEWTNLRITPLGANAAVSAFQFRDSIVTNTGDLIQAQGPTTLVWQRRDGHWKLISGDADHYPVDRAGSP